MLERGAFCVVRRYANENFLCWKFGLNSLSSSIYYFCKSAQFCLPRSSPRSNRDNLTLVMHFGAGQ